MIIVNARFLTQNTTGVQRFAIEISKELKKSGLDIQFVSPKNIIDKEIASELGVKRIGFLKGHLWEQITLQIYALRKRSLLVSLCNTAPCFIKKQVVTIHDLSFRLHPEWNSKIFSITYNFLIPFLAKRSLHVLTVSNTAKKELINELKLKENKISVIYNAVSKVFDNQEVLSEVKGLESEKYVLTVSSLHPRKNLGRLIEAFRKMPDPNLKLYIIGNINKHFTREVILEKEVLSRIKILENINDKQLASYYRNAKIFVYPSVYEGFGIPIIEAMNYKVPVCVSNISVFKEVCGSEATYFNPYDINDIKNKMITCLQEKRRPSINISEKFNWTKSAETIKIIILNIIKINY